VAPKSTDPAAEERETDRAKGPALRKNALMQALEMNDDLSGLVSSMRRPRARDESSGDIRGQAWLDHVLDEQAPEKLAGLKQQLRNLATPDLAALRSLIQQMFPDGSDALAIVRTLLSDAELEEMHQTLRQLQEELASGDGAKATLGGLNVALKARMQAPRLRASARQLRRSYQDFLAGGDPIETYELWMELYGFDRRAMVVDFIEQALAADMYALDPSCSRLEFGHLLQVVRQLTTLRSADYLLLKHCWHAALMARLDVQPFQLVAALLRMVRLGGGLQELFAGLLAHARFVMSATDKVIFAQGIRRFLKALPHGLWPEVGLQLQALNEVETLLDRALEQEQRSAGPGYRVEV
jgi:type III secretion protein W